MSFVLFLRWCLIVTAATFPLYLMRFSVRGIPFSVPEVLIVILAGTCGIYFLKNYFRVQSDFFSRNFLRVRNFLSAFFFERFIKRFVKKTPWYLSWYLPIGFLFFGLLISLAVTPEAFFSRGLGILKSWFVIPILYAFLIVKIFDGARDVRRSLDFYSLSALFLAGWGIWQWARGNYLTPDMRASGPFDSANYLALFLAPACLYLFLRAWHLFLDRRIFSFVYGLGAVIGFFALYQTKSFGAFLGIFGALFLYAMYFFLKTSGGWKKIIALFFGLLFVGTIFFVTGDREKFRAAFRFSERSSTAVRLEVWKISGRFIGEHPIAGIGLGTYQNFYEKRAAEILGHPPFEPSILHPHNVILMFWTASGIFGLIGFLWLIVIFFVTFFRKIPDERKRIAGVIAAMMLVLLIHGLVDVPIWKNDLALQFWLLVAGMRRIQQA